MKSGGDFADILAADNPDVWQSHRPAKGGDTGAMFARIIERALAIKQERKQVARPRGSNAGSEEADACKEDGGRQEEDRRARRRRRRRSTAATKSSAASKKPNRR